MTDREMTGKLATLGFCAFADNTFELIVQDPDTYQEVTLTGTLTSDQYEKVDAVLPCCVFTKGLVRPTAEHVREELARILDLFNDEHPRDMDAALDAILSTVGLQP